VFVVFWYESHFLFCNPFLLWSFLWLKPRFCSSTAVRTFFFPTLRDLLTFSRIFSGNIRNPSRRFVQLLVTLLDERRCPSFSPWGLLLCFLFSRTERIATLCRVYHPVLDDPLRFPAFIGSAGLASDFTVCAHCGLLTTADLGSIAGGVYPDCALRTLRKKSRSFTCSILVFCCIGIAWSVDFTLLFFSLPLLHDFFRFSLR